MTSPKDLEDTWLENFILQLGHHFRYKGGVGVCEERHRRHQGATIIVDHVLPQLFRQFPEDQLFVKEFSLVSVLEIPAKKELYHSLIQGATVELYSVILFRVSRGSFL